MKTGRPLIGIPSPTSFDLAYNHQNWPQYAEAVREAGGDPLILELSVRMQEWTAVVQQCSGFVLPGSPADIEPARYGERSGASTAPADPGRETLDRLILDEAEQSGKPVLGICFGLQSMNIWRGGTLIQDLSPLPVNHSAGSSVAAAHTASIAKTSLLGSLLTSSETSAEGLFHRILVNSSHHQAVSRPGEGFTVVARCIEDGTVEALEGRIGSAPMMGVQWHPERSTAISPASRSLFLWLTSSALDCRDGFESSHVHSF